MSGGVGISLYLCRNPGRPACTDNLKYILLQILAVADRLQGQIDYPVSQVLRFTDPGYQLQVTDALAVDTFS